MCKPRNARDACSHQQPGDAGRALPWSRQRERGHPVNTFIPGFSFLSTERINTCCFKPRPQTWSFIPATPGNPHTLPAGLIPTTHGTRQAPSRLRGGIRTHGIYLCPFLAGL